MKSLYLSADGWFGIIYTVIAEITPVEIHGVTTALFLFILNNIAGNLPIVVAPLSRVLGLRGALFIMSPMLVGVSKSIDLSHVAQLHVSTKEIERSPPSTNVAF